MSQDESNELKPATPPGETPPANPLPDEPGSLALAEALRSSFFFVRIIMVGLVVLFFAHGFFTVGPQEKAIILRLGSPVGQGEAALLGPGAHWSLPPPIDEVVRIPYSALQTADSTIGWYQTAQERARGAPAPMPTDSLDPRTISYALTADTNIVHVVAALKYKITDPIKFQFDFVDAPMFVTNALDNALLFAASRFTVDDLLTRQREAVRETVKARVVDLLTKEGLGVSVESVSLFDASPPLALSNAFNRVTQAASDRDRTINDAISYQAKTLGDAGGEKESRIKSAEADKSRLIGLVRAEATNFSRLLPYYEKDAHSVTRLLQLEGFKDIWDNAQEKEVLPNMDGRQLRLHLSPPATPLTMSTNQPSP